MKYTDPSGHGTTSGSDRVDDNADFYEDMYDSQYDTIPEYEDFLQDMQDAQNEGTNQSALYDLVDEMNQSGGLDAEDQSTIHDWADEYGVDYDSLGVNAASERGTSKYYNPDGSPIWPPNRGFDGNPTKVILEPGTLIDRYGYDGGTFVSPKGTSYTERALPIGTDQKPYTVFEVVKPIEVQAGKIAPWFGEKGGGIQYEFS